MFHSPRCADHRADELLACIGEEEKQWGEEVRQPERGSNDMIGDDVVRRRLQQRIAGSK